MLLIKVNCLPGDFVEDVAREMWRLKERLGIEVECDFNGVSLCTRGVLTPEKMVERWKEEIKAKWASNES